MERAAVTVSQLPSVVFRDGLGERRQASDATGTEAIELLCLRSELAAVPSFEFALRERVSRLGGFRHAYYGRVRGVERANDREQTLAVASDATSGIRLSDLLARTEERRVPLDINAALCLIRQLVPAVAMLHENAKDVAHGALGPERLVITSNARLVIVEYVLGAALEQLRYSQERYWSELRIALPRSSGLPRFDHRADVTQVGVVALSLILGRPLREDEYPARVGDVVAATWAVSPRGGFEPLPPGLRGWLGRALQLEAHNSFGSAIEARAELDKVLGDSEYIASPASLESYLARYQAADRPAPRVAPVPTPSALIAPVTAPISVPPPAAHVAPAPVAPAPVAMPAAPPPIVEPPAPAPTILATPPTAVARATPPISVARPVQAPPPLVMPKPMPPPAPIVVAPPPPAAPAPVSRPEPSASLSVESSLTLEPLPERPPLFELQPEVEPVFDSPQPAQLRRGLWVGVAAAVVVLAAAGVFASRRMFAPKPVPVSTGTLVITTDPAGAQTFVDGAPQGLTPITLTLSAGSHNVELRGAGEPRTIPVTITAGMQVAQYVDLPKAAADVGQLQVKTEPSGARVSVDGSLRGTAPVLVGGLMPGVHTVIVESELGSVKQTVNVESGTTAALVVPLGAPPTGPASGWVTIAAPFDVQIFEKGELLGSSQTDRIMVRAGRHDLDIVNDALGYSATKSVQVPAGKVSNLTLEVPKGTISLNALPWAEVWIDGEKIGETPIGNLSLAIGKHDIVFRHPDLGEQHQTATITTNDPARLSVDLRKK